MTEIRNWTLDLATAPTEDLLREAEHLRSKRALAKERGRIVEEQAYALRLADLDRSIAIRNRRATEALDAQQAQPSVDSLVGWLRYALENWAPGGSDKADKARAELEAYDSDHADQRAQREQDLREAYLHGCLFVFENVTVTDSGAGPSIDVPSLGNCEDMATQYARSKVGA
jgi:hypothetical protein